MADTVKKSRIVSETDENLEECLLEEFNQRLKKCLSQDDLNPPDLATATNLFIENERRDSLTTSNGHADYEITCESPDSPPPVRDEPEPKSVKDRMFLSTDDASCLLFTQTVTSPMLTPSEENIDFLQGFKRESISNESPLCNGNGTPNVADEEEPVEPEQQPQFEQIDTNVCVNIDVSTVTETHYVETTTTETNGLKKKKSKKSKSQHEKENISVCDETNEDSCYNVNVKNLCRSFGDLSKIDADRHHRWKCTERSRTKSMSDLRPIRTGRIFTGVSVKELRERFSNVSTNHVLLNNITKSKMLKSSFSKFDALQKKNQLNLQQVDQNDTDTSNCKKCGRPVFQMERVIAERCVWHRNCFRCAECSKQLLVDNFESHEGTVYCKSHFKLLFQPKAVEDELPTSDKPDLGLEELHSLNVKERFQVFENIKDSAHDHHEKNSVKMERSPSILSKLARFQAKGMDVGVNDECLDGIPIEASSSEEEAEAEGEDADLIRAKRVQKEKPFHFLQMSDVKSRWEQGNSQKRDDIREERKQEIQNIRSRLFLGKQGKMKEAYQQAVVESESGAALKKEVPIDTPDTRSIKDRFERGDVVNSEIRRETEDMSIFESGIGKKSRSIFLELDAETTKPPKLSPTSPVKLSTSVRNAREAYIAKQASEDTVRSFERMDEISVRTADIHDRFKFFETYKEPEQKRREFRMTPPREGQTKSKTPERDVYVDPDIVRSDETVEDSVVAKSAHTATKMLSKFRQMEENLMKGQESAGPKPLKRFTPPREPARRESSSERESGSEEESETEVDNVRVMEQDLVEAQKAARAQKLRAKFERWEENEIKRENSVSVIGDEQGQIETARSLCAKFESLRDSNNVQQHTNRVKVNRFVVSNATCKSCEGTVYPLEMIAVHGLTFHKNCFRCNECKMILRMNSYSYNRGLLYCTTHFKRLFITKGNYDSGFGLEQHKDKWGVRTAA
ncbi:uncharacterized protein LOC116161072 isoform X3 [Photinus pyralis]|uniref:uncharacterized protein LOC116161072 isoform X3 n=1 Tax=Photinus pyralis TaxID=7054 RepID=UPI0012675B75|nr:uncharacterized protein LOC116161072 isoform X3 [Photinus pyralis]